MCSHTEAVTVRPSQLDLQNILEDNPIKINGDNIFFTEESLSNGILLVREFISLDNTGNIKILGLGILV